MSAKPTDLQIRFRDCEAGWIHMDVTHVSDTVSVNLSHVFEPLPAFLAWLEAVSTGVEQCSFVIDEEGSLVEFKATTLNSGKVRFQITPNYESTKLDLNLSARELVGAMYRAYVEFSESPDYKPEEWESYLLGDAVRDHTGLSQQQWVDSMLTLNRRELQKAIWRLDRDTCVDIEYARQSENFASDDEVLELTGKPAEAGTLLSYWHCDGWENLTSENEKTKFLLEALEERINSWDGFPWPRMRSVMLEKWLQSPAEKPYQEWRRWLSLDAPN
jgi:hypothetical protein